MRFRNLLWLFVRLAQNSSGNLELLSTQQAEEMEGNFVVTKDFTLCFFRGHDPKAL